MSQATTWLDQSTDHFDVFSDCNINGLDKIDAKDPSTDFFSVLGNRATHVFNARLGNNGKGNGGEAVDIDFFGGITGVTCISTPDEDTGGTLNVGFPIFPTMFAPEIDPGNSAD